MGTGGMGCIPTRNPTKQQAENQRCSPATSCPPLCEVGCFPVTVILPLPSLPAPFQRCPVNALSVSMPTNTQQLGTTCSSFPVGFQWQRASVPPFPFACPTARWADCGSVVHRCSGLRYHLCRCNCLFHGEWVGLVQCARVDCTRACFNRAVWWPVANKWRPVIVHFAARTHTTPHAPSHPRMFVHATRINDTTSAHCWLLWCGRGPPCGRRRASPPLPLAHPPPCLPRPRPCPSPPPRAPTSWAHPPSPPCSRLSGTRTRHPRSSLHMPIG